MVIIIIPVTSKNRYKTTNKDKRSMIAVMPAENLLVHNAKKAGILI